MSSAQQQQAVALVVTGRGDVSPETARREAEAAQILAAARQAGACTDFGADPAGPALASALRAQAARIGGWLLAFAAVGGAMLLAAFLAAAEQGF